MWPWAALSFVESSVPQSGSTSLSESSSLLWHLLHLLCPVLNRPGHSTETLGGDWASLSWGSHLMRSERKRSSNCFSRRCPTGWMPLSYTDPILWVAPAAGALQRVPSGGAVPGDALNPGLMAQPKVLVGFWHQLLFTSSGLGASLAFPASIFSSAKWGS